MRKNTTGFTIVELLIVIVVIAILAAISIVAYTGIQQRARDSAVLSDLSQVSRQFELYYAEHGQYPATQIQARNLGVRFSFSPVTSSVLLCSDASGYTIFARHTSATSRQFRVTSGGGAPERLTTNLTWAAAGLCTTAGYPLIGWGSGWVQGG